VSARTWRGRATASNAAPAYAVGYASRAEAIIVDNDRTRPPTCRLDDDSVHFTVPARNGARFAIQWSSNLTDWTTICTNEVTDGALHYADPEAKGLRTRFYKVVPR